jgi:RES domain-containing protein
LIAYRIGSPAHTLLDGTGAAASDVARWNSRGRYIIYAAEHYATALLEKAAQLNSIRIPRSLVYTRVEIPPDAGMEVLQARDLPGWASEDKAVSQGFGDRWYDEQRSLILLVPSLVAPGLQRNVLINQRHRRFSEVTATPPQPIRCHPRLLL